jgi:quercetin dioxygenase-like cupin family protein
MLRYLIPYMLATASLAQAQPVEPVKRTPLQKVELPGDRLVAIQALIEVAPNAVVERHSHHGVEMVYVLEGTIALDIDGQPSRLLKAGDSAVNPSGVPHGGRAGPQGARLTGTFIVDKDKPLATSAK